LISCLGERTGGGLFAYDGKDLEQLDTLSTTGLAFADGRLGRLLWSSGDAGSVGELMVYDEIGVERYVRIDSLREPHDLAWNGQEFLAVSTLSNSILWLSPSGEVIHTWRADGDGDAWHLNSLFPVNGTVVAAAFGRFSNHRDWSDGRAAGAGIVFDLKTGADVVNGLSCPHHPRLIEGSWLICNSAERELVLVDPVSGSIERRIGLEGWTRGLAVDDGVIYVGESANRAEPAPGELASVAVIDRQTWSVVDRLPLPSEEVFDVIEVPASLARSVRTGFRTNPLRAAEQDQHSLFREAGVRPPRLWAVGEPLPASSCRIRISAALPERLAAGTIHDCECVITNAGDAILVTAPPNPVHISYRWSCGDRKLEGLRFALPQALAPGAERACRFTLQAPEETGDYRLTVTAVQEQVAWFDDVDAGNAWSAVVRIA
jgi:hypothetical protein